MNIEKRNGQLRKNCVRILNKLAEESGTDLSPFFFSFFPLLLFLLYPERVHRILIPPRYLLHSNISFSTTPSRAENTFQMELTYIFLIENFPKIFSNLAC